MRIFDLIFRGGKSLEEAKRLSEQKLYLQMLGSSIGATLGQTFFYRRLRDAFYSQDEVITITPPGRELFHISRMKKIEKKNLLFQKETVGDAKNIFSKKHFEAIGGAFGWDCEIYLSDRGNTPALFKTEKAWVWLAPIILKV